MYHWPRPAQYPYPYGTTYLQSHYQPNTTSFSGTVGNHQGANYYPSFQSRLHAMANHNITKDNPQVCIYTLSFKKYILNIYLLLSI